MSVREWAWELEQDLLGWEHPPIEAIRAEVFAACDTVGSWCRRCGQSVGAGELTSRGCGSCRGSPTSLSAMVRIGSYGGALARAILQTKHTRWHEMAEFLGATLGAQAALALARHQRPDVIVPVPMPWLRRWWRGIDHTRGLADAVARELGARCWPRLRQKLGATQVSRTRTERRRATARFSLGTRPGKAACPIAGAIVGVVDDVRTTGATLEQVAGLLLREGAEAVVGLVVAVAANPRRRIPPTASALLRTDRSKLGMESGKVTGGSQVALDHGSAR